MFVHTDGYVHKWKHPHRPEVYQARLERATERQKTHRHEYYVAHKDGFRESGRKWREANPEKVAAIERRYRERHPDRAVKRCKEWEWRHKDERRERDRRCSADPAWREKRNERVRIMRRLSKLVDHLRNLGILDHEDLEAIRHLRLTRERILYVTARVTAVQGQWEGRKPSEMFESLGRAGADSTRLYLGLNLIDMRSALGVHHIDYHVDLFKSWEVTAAQPTTADSSSDHAILASGRNNPAKD